MHGARSSSSRMLQHIDGWRTDHCDILPENRKCEEEHRRLNLRRLQKKQRGMRRLLPDHHLPSMCAEVEEMKAALMVGFLSVADSIVRCCCSCQDLNGSIAKLPELPGQWVPDSSLQMLSPSALFIPTRIALRRTGPRYRYRHRSCCEI
jgi:hypothetical protein